MFHKSSVNVFLLGNAAHERIVPLLTNTKINVNYNSGMIFVRDKNDLEIGLSNFGVYQSDRVPYNTKVIVLPHGKDHETIKPEVTESIFLVESWTVLNTESLETAKKFRRNYPYNELKIALFNSNRKTLSTDVTDEQAALYEAIVHYEKEGFSVTVIENQDVPNLFFWQERKYSGMLKRNFKEKLANAKSLFEGAYELHYEMLLRMLKDDMLQPGTLDSFTHYDENLGGKKIKQIVDCSIKSFFCVHSQFIIELDEILKTFTKEICLWDEPKVLENLVNVLEQQFCKDMKSTLPAVKFDRTDEISYYKFLYDTKFNVIFAQNCNCFFNDTAKGMIKSYIDMLLIKLDGAL